MSDKTLAAIAIITWLAAISTKLIHPNAPRKYRCELVVGRLLCEER